MKDSLSTSKPRLSLFAIIETMKDLRAAEDRVIELEEQRHTFAEIERNQQFWWVPQQWLATAFQPCCCDVLVNALLNLDR